MHRSIDLLLGEIEERAAKIPAYQNFLKAWQDASDSTMSAF